SLSTLTRPRFAHPAAAYVPAPSPLDRSTPLPRTRLASLPGFPLADSSRLRRPPAPTYSLRKNRLKARAGTPSEALTRLLLRPPRRHRLPVAYGGFRNAFGVFIHFCFQKEGRFAPAGSQTNRPSFRKHLWEAGGASTLGK